MSEAISPPQMSWLADFLQMAAGLKASAEKAYLVDARLSPIVRKEKLASIDALIDFIRANPSSRLRTEVIDAMTVNETSFFRDGKPFEMLRNVLVPEVLKRSPKRIRIWSAAASSGQEAFSIAMALNKMPEMNGVEREIVGTDVSTQIIEKAKSGIYSQFEVQRGLPARDLVANFVKSGTDWQVNQTLRSCVKFSVANILSPPASLGMFDIVFCRNLLIYFDPATKRRALNEIVQRMNPSGYLVIGGTETILGLHPKLQQVKELHAVYQKV